MFEKTGVAFALGSDVMPVLRCYRCIELCQLPLDIAFVLGECLPRGSLRRALSVASTLGLCAREVRGLQWRARRRAASVVRKDEDEDDFEDDNDYDDDEEGDDEEEEDDDDDDDDDDNDEGDEAPLLVALDSDGGDGGEGGVENVVHVRCQQVWLPCLAKHDASSICQRNAHLAERRSPPVC